MTSEYSYLEPGNSCFFSTLRVSCRFSLEINRSHFSFFFMFFEFYFGDEWRGGEEDVGKRRKRRKRGGEETKVNKIITPRHPWYPPDMGLFLNHNSLHLTLVKRTQTHLLKIFKRLMLFFILWLCVNLCTWGQIPQEARKGHHRAHSVWHNFIDIIPRTYSFLHIFSICHRLHTEGKSIKTQG